MCVFTFQGYWPMMKTFEYMGISFVLFTILALYADNVVPSGGVLSAFLPFSHLHSLYNNKGYHMISKQKLIMCL